MPRTALPTNYNTKPSTLLEDFENSADFIITSGTGIIISDTTNFITGSKSLKITSTTNNSNVGITKNINFNFTGPRIELLFYCDDSERPPTVGMYLSSTTNFSKYFYKSQSTIVKGWNRWEIHKNDFSVTGGESWNNTMIRLKLIVYAQTNANSHVSFDSLKSSDNTVPKCIITFDDGYPSNYTEGYSYMKSKGLKGNIYVITSLIDANDHLTIQELEELYNDNWGIANHTRLHQNLTTLSQADAQTDIQNGMDDLVAYGFTRTKDHLAYPGGNYNDTVILATRATTSKTARGLATAQNYPSLAHDNLVDDNYRLKSYILSNTISLATAKGYIDSAILTGGTVILCLHKLVQNATNSLEWGINDFKALINYIVAKGIDVVTLDEWYDGLTNPRYRSGFTRTPRP